MEKLIEILGKPTNYTIKAHFGSGAFAFLFVWLMYEGSDGLFLATPTVWKLLKAHVVEFGNLPVATSVISLGGLLTAITVLGAAINTLSYGIIEILFYRKIWGRAEEDMLDIHHKECLPRLVRGFSKPGTIFGTVPVDPDFISRVEKATGIDKTRKTATTFEILRSKVGADFNRNPRADLLTANGDFARSVSFVGLFGMCLMVLGEIEDSSHKYQGFLLLSSMIFGGGFLAFVRFRESLLKLYLRSALFWFDGTSALNRTDLSHQK